MSNRFVFVAPMYNASSTLPQMLHSICGQSYCDWKLILIDDVSSPEHAECCRRTIDQFQCMLNGRYSEKIDVIRNSEKKWEVANVLTGISMCRDDDIVCRIDADDWLTDMDALTMIDTVYRQRGCEALWTAHRWGFTDTNISRTMDACQDPHSHPWVSSHLKTFRRHLLNSVPRENFLGIDGEYVKRAGDQAIYLPALHNANGKWFFLPRCCYHYSIDLNDKHIFKSEDARFQKSEAEFIRNRGYVSKGTPWEDGFRS